MFLATSPKHARTETHVCNHCMTSCSSVAYFPCFHFHGGNSTHLEGNFLPLTFFSTFLFLELYQCIQHFEEQYKQKDSLLSPEKVLFKFGLSASCPSSGLFAICAHLDGDKASDLGSPKDQATQGPGLSCIRNLMIRIKLCWF